MAVPAVAPAVTNGVSFVALERQHTDISTELIGAFVQLLGSSAFTLGAAVEQFETEFAGFCGVGHCVGVASGTAAIELMIRASGIGPGDEVVVPGHTFIASALAVAHAGAVPVLCDVDEKTGLIDPDAARAVVGPRTAAVLAVHLYGQCCDMNGLRAVTEPRGLLLLEDAAQAHGARYRDRKAGALGAAAAFSFYPSKNLGALGDGGAVCTNDEMLAARVRRLRDLGQRAKGEHVELGYNERLDALQAALLRVKLPYLDQWNEQRRAHAATYRRLISDEVQLVEERPESPSVYHVFPVRLKERHVVAAALRQHGVETGIHYAPAVHKQSVWGGQGMRHGELSVAESWAAEELSLPMHPALQWNEIEYVVDALHAGVIQGGLSRGPQC